MFIDVSVVFYFEGVLFGYPTVVLLFLNVCVPLFTYQFMTVVAGCFAHVYVYK